LVALAAVLIEEILKNLVRGQVTPEDVEGFRQRQLGQDANVKRILRRFLWRTQYHERVGTLFPGFLYSTRSAVVQMRSLALPHRSCWTSVVLRGTPRVSREDGVPAPCRARHRCSRRGDPAMR